MARAVAQELTKVLADSFAVYLKTHGYHWNVRGPNFSQLHALFMDARFSDGTVVNDNRLNFGAANASVDLGGNWLPRVSPYTINYTLSQLIFTQQGSFDWVIQAQTRGKHFMSVYNGEGNMELAAPGGGL